MQTLLFLQNLGIDRQTIRDLLVEAGLPLTPIWEDWRQVEAPEEVFGVVTVQAAADDEILHRFPNVPLIGVAFTGYDCLDLKACRRRDIAVYNVPAYSTDSVAELTMALAICLLRDIPRADGTVHASGWKSERWGTELSGKTVGILGTGAIGLRVAELFRACKCRLIRWSRSQRGEFSDLGGMYVSKEEILSTADVVTLHVPLDGLIDITSDSVLTREELVTLWEATYTDPDDLEEARELCGPCVDAVLAVAGRTIGFRE